VLGIGPVTRDNAHGRTHRLSLDGESYGFVIYDQTDRACVYLGFSTWRESDRAGREARSLLGGGTALLAAVGGGFATYEGALRRESRRQAIATDKPAFPFATRASIVITGGAESKRTLVMGVRMDQAIVGILGGLCGGTLTLLGGILNAKSQERAVRLRAETDVRLQADRLQDAAKSAELTLRRSKLEELTIFLNEVVEQCSETQGMLDREMGLGRDAQGARWAALNVKLRQAKATADIYFPDLSEHVDNAGARMQKFNWQDRKYLQSDEPVGSQEWERLQGQLAEAGLQVARAVTDAIEAVAVEAKRLTVD
jgi:hypothetical protein